MRRVCRGLVVVALVLVVAARATPGDEESRTHVLELNKITGLEPMVAALQELKENPERTKKLLQTGLTLVKEKKLQYNAAIVLAQAAADLKDLKASEAFYRFCADQAVKLSSTKKLLESYGGLIDLLYDNKKYPEAARVCRELIELKLDDGKPREYYLAQKTRFDEVDFFPVEEFDAALPLRGGVHRLLIQAQSKQGKHEQALKLVENLIKERDHWRERELKGWVLNEAGKLSEAAAAYEDVVQRIKDDKRLEVPEREFYSFRNRYILSHIYVDLKQIDKATEHLEALLARKPRDPDMERRWIGLHNDLGYIWADNDLRLPEAEKLIRKALELDAAFRKGDAELENQENGAYLDSLGWVLFKQEKYKEAKEVLQRALKDKSAQHIEIYDHLGDVHLMLGEREAAAAAWRKGLEFVRPDDRRDVERRAIVEKKLAKHAK
jgi:tetratricopeptide (TPR) repeat protein